MLPTFIIGLREGVEAALIVGIIAAFLVQEGRRDGLRWMWAGVAAAVLICVGVAVALQVAEQRSAAAPAGGARDGRRPAGRGDGHVHDRLDAPPRARPGGRAAHERRRAALAEGSMIALVAMAFFAVIREGFETAVFMLAAFQSSTDPTAAGFGAVLGVAVACLIGWGIYTGGVRLNLAKFFKFTGFILVLVAAGLFAGAMHTAHGAGWLTAGQDQALDLSWLVVPGTWTASLLTGMLGLQPKPTVIEVGAYLAYAIPMGIYVLWPQRRPARSSVRAAAGATALLVLGADARGLRQLGQRIERRDPPGQGRAHRRGLHARGDQDRAGSDDVRRLQHGDGQGQRVRDPRRGARPRGEGERRRGHRRRLHAQHEAGPVHDRVPGRVVVGDRRADRGGRARRPRPPTRSSRPRPPATRATSRRRRRSSRSACARSRRPSRAATPRRRRRSSPRPARRTRRSSRWPRASGTSIPEIDARVNDVAKGDPWTGFHRIEQGLWVKNSTAGLGKYADALMADVNRLVDEGPGSEVRAGGARQRRERPARRGLGLEDHRRGGPLLAHRPVGLRGQRARLAGGLRAARAGTAQAQSGARGDDPASASPPCSRSSSPTARATASSPTTRSGRPSAGSLSQGVDALAEPLSKVAAELQG